jgi:hypothetical protein
MTLTRRLVLSGAAAIGTGLGAGCTAKMGSKGSYLTQILAPQNNNTVYHWLDIIMQQVRDQRVPPPRAAVAFGAPLVAGFLAVNGILRKYAEPYGIGVGPHGANLDVAYGVAFATAASEAFQQPFLFERAAFLKKFPDGEAKSLGIKWGRYVGLKIVKMRTDDAAHLSKANHYRRLYKRRQDSLRWQPTGTFFSAKPSPAFTSFPKALFPGHGGIRPWTMKSGSQFRVPGFYHPASPEFAKEFEMIRTLGGKMSPARTKDETEIALFWEDGPWGVTPPGHFLYLAVQAHQHIPTSFIDLARNFALLGMTQCDASICAWDSKYYHDILRPESAIRARAPYFNNADPRVRRHASWQSYIPTPEFPAYTSGHSTFGAAAAGVMKHIIGHDNVPMVGITPDEVLWPQLKGVVRRWRGFDHAAEENGMSRLYGGVHWELDHRNGMRSGYEIARHACQTMFPRYA